LTDDQRRRLAAKGKRLGRQVLRQVATIVTPDTILRWYRSKSGRPARGMPAACETITTCPRSAVSLTASTISD
jgi:hypothetical protein